MKISCIVPSAGKGKRLKANVDKVFVLLDNKPILYYTLKNLEASKEIGEIVLVVSKESLEFSCNEFLKKFKFSKIKKIVEGGKTRTESVWRGLQSADEKSKFILIHDGARPFVDEDCLNRLIKAGEEFGSAVLGLPITSTVKKVRNSFVSKTVPRDYLWEIQTPQIFKRDLIIDCYKKAIEEKFIATDDAQILEHYGYKVKIVKGSPLNIKITTPEDLTLAKAILKIRSK
ncbi:MAG: 2-C-methyl-D-erythritol 4-phosphate cytidylyltransferase [Candidatus Omnitrophota bacterium]